ncbi:MAG: hypothetical protein AAF950_17290 [Pseudomonadota bacterium]
METDVLSANEERLLSVLSDKPSEGSPIDDIQSCREALEYADVTLRPVSSILRSGRDALLRKIARSYMTF